MLSHRIIMTVVAPAALALAFAAFAAQAQSPRVAEERYKRGLALAQRGELDRAIAEFDKAIELNPRLDAMAQRLALNVLGNDVAQAPVFSRNLADLVNRDDVWMVKSARGAGFPRKALHATILGCELGG